MPQSTLVDIVMQNLEESKAAIAALDALGNAEQNARFYQRRKRGIAKLFADFPSYLAVVEAFAKAEQKKYSKKPGNIALVVNHGLKDTELIVPVSTAQHPLYQSLSQSLSEYNPHEGKNGPYISLIMRNPKTKKSADGISAGMHEAVLAAYSGIKLEILDVFGMQLPDSVQQKYAPKTQRKITQNVRRKHVEIGDSYLEVDLTPSDTEYGIVHLPKKSRSLFPPFDEKFIMHFGDETYTCKVSGSPNNGKGAVDAGGFISQLTDFYHAHDIAKGSSGQIVRLERIAENEYRITLPGIPQP